MSDEMNFLFFIVLQALDNLGSDNREFYDNTMPIPEYLKDLNSILIIIFSFPCSFSVLYKIYSIFIARASPTNKQSPVRLHTLLFWGIFHAMVIFSKLLLNTGKNLNTKF